MTPRERFLAACNRESVDATPVWFMRQAGRYLREYKEIKGNRPVLEICKIPEICEKITILPLTELDVDAAVMFADIMLPLEGMGVQLHIEEDVGPIIHNKIERLSDAEVLKEFLAKEHIPYVLETIKRVKERLKESKKALIGFSGAPFTLASYMIEGRPSRDFVSTKKMMYGDKETWKLLMTKLSTMVSDYLASQIESGVDSVQLFDSWVGTLSARDYLEYVAPYTNVIFKRLRSEYGSTPTIHFGTGTSHLLRTMKDKVGGDVFSVDWRIPLRQALQILGRDNAIQGNLEPSVLTVDPRMRDFIASRVSEILEEGRDAEGHIFNLGHGVLRETPVENAKYVVNYVHENSKRG